MYSRNRNRTCSRFVLSVLIQYSQILFQSWVEEKETVITKLCSVLPGDLGSDDEPDQSVWHLQSELWNFDMKTRPKVFTKLTPMCTYKPWQQPQEKTCNRNSWKKNLFGHRFRMGMFLCGPMIQLEIRPLVFIEWSERFTSKNEMFFSLVYVYSYESRYRYFPSLLCACSSGYRAYLMTVFILLLLWSG